MNYCRICSTSTPSKQNKASVAKRVFEKKNFSFKYARSVCFRLAKCNFSINWNSFSQFNLRYCNYTTTEIRPAVLKRSASCRRIADLMAPLAGSFPESNIFFLGIPRKKYHPREKSNESSTPSFFFSYRTF